MSTVGDDDGTEGRMYGTVSVVSVLDGDEDLGVWFGEKDQAFDEKVVGRVVEHAVTHHNPRDVVLCRGATAFSPQELKSCWGGVGAMLTASSFSFRSPQFSSTTSTSPTRGLLAGQPYTTQHES
jgi:hypothetical protein